MGAPKASTTLKPFAARSGTRASQLRPDTVLDIRLSVFERSSQMRPSVLPRISISSGAEEPPPWVTYRHMMTAFLAGLFILMLYIKYRKMFPNRQAIPPNLIVNHPGSVRLLSPAEIERELNAPGTKL